jgi:two-component system cell cycle sensor histidine kinase/response regulator CckA
LALDKVDPVDPLHADLGEILAAATRSADITRQLLAFSRQQIIAPKVLDLNAAVDSVLKMLRRLIGEDIDLVWLPGAQMWPVHIDPTQVDQILANLCVNAQDAIGGVGKVTIETDNINLDAASCDGHVHLLPGQYAVLAVSDDGHGIAPDDLDKIFEPFFTTKALGKGTGLGLATVYGIVKQNNGFIDVSSDQGKGTTIKIYLPRQTGQAVMVHRDTSPDIPPGCGETILIVDDNGAILEVGQRMLQSLGYIVLSAVTPREADRLAAKHAGGINLLITDVVMPEMNGRQLSEHLNHLCPNLKTLFMSGYTADAIAHRGVLEEGVCLINKPFSKKDLAVKVRQVLDNDNR